MCTVLSLCSALDCTEPQDGCQGAFSMVRMEVYCSIYKLDRVSSQRDSGPADCTSTGARNRL